MRFAQIAVFEGHGRPIRIATHPLPERLDEGEVLVAISLATVCGSDLHTLEGRRNEPVPSVLGHEAVGRIAAMGPGRPGWRLGERVTWTLADSCGCCRPCSEWDLPQKCDRLFKYGHAALSDGSGLNGCYASHIILRRGTEVVRLPDGIVDAMAAPVNCALATMIAAVETLPSTCRTVVVQGAGLLGLYGCALLRARGVPRVVLVDLNASRLALAKAFGGEAVEGSALGCVPPGGADAVFEVAGTSSVIPEGMRLLRPGGHYVWVGMVHPESRLELTGKSVIRKCLQIRGIHNYAPRHLRAAVAFLAETQSAYPWNRLVSPPLPLTRLEDAVRLARTGMWARVGVVPDFVS